MCRITLSEEELKESYNKQLGLLRSHVYGFPKNNDLACDIATKLRVFCYDKGKQYTSLLTHMKIKGSVEIPNTYFHESSGNNAPLSGLVYQTLDFVDGAKFVPKFDEQPEGVKTELVSFEEWWNTVVLRDIEGNEFSRRDLVLEVADTDGGAHVDGGLKQDYYKVSRQHTLSWKFSKNNEASELIPGVVLSSLCQIGHELLSAVLDDYEPPEVEQKGMRAEFSLKGNPGKEVFGNNLPFRMETEIKAPNGKDRNRECPCGSGRKWKHCHPEGERISASTDPISS